MSTYSATASYLPGGVNRANLFAIIVTMPAMTVGQTIDVTLPDGVPKDALPLGPPQSFSLSGDVYTKDTDVGDVTTHNRSTGVTTITATGTITVGEKMLLLYAGTG